MADKRTTSEMYTRRRVRVVAFGLLALVIGLMLVFGRSDAALAAVSGTDVTHTLDADFDQGTLLNVNHDAPNNDQLQLNQTTTPFPFVNVAASSRGTMVRIEANTGAIVGEYRVAPQGFGLNPSRTTVDLFGNVWTGNRNESGFIGGVRHGSVVKIGLIIGGSRVNADSTPNPVGDYLAPPFGYSTCVDRDGDGLIKTSRGLTDIRPWINATDGVGSTDGAPHGAQVQDADDECILIYQRTSGAEAVRHVSVDANNNVWVGGYPFSLRNFHLLDENNGGVLATFNAGAFGCGGYGGLVDGNGVLWSASISHSRLLRYDTNNTITTADDSGSCVLVSQSYGLGIDTNGFVWNSMFQFNSVVKVNSAGVIQAGFPKTTGGSSGDRGVAVTPLDNNVWVANSFGNNVSRLNNAGGVLQVVTVGNTPTGVAVDSNGKIWATNLSSNSVSRIDPNFGGPGVAGVDLTVGLGGGAGPYNYSDMTGIIAIGATSPQGTWTVVQNAGALGTAWGNVSWNGEAQGSEPAGTSITVQARASDTEAGLAGEVFVAVSNGVDFSLTGQFIEVRATLFASPGGVSPILSDLRIRTLAVDTTPPSCEVTNLVAGPPATIVVTIQDGGSGIDQINIVTADNATVDIPTFSSGATNPIVVTGKKNDKDLSSTLRLEVIDVAGNVTECDPVLVSLSSEPGSRVARQTVTSLPHADRYLTLYSDDPSAGFVLVTVNGKWFAVLTGAGTIDVGSALVEGSDNTITLRGWDAEGLVMISDMVPPHDSGSGGWALTRWNSYDSWQPY